MAKPTKGRKPARKSVSKGAGARARPAGKGKAAGKKFFVGKAPRPAHQSGSTVAAGETLTLAVRSGAAANWFTTSSSTR